MLGSFRQIKQISLVNPLKHLYRVQNYWVPPTPLNEMKVLVPYKLIAKLDLIEQTIKTIMKTQPLDYSSSQAIHAELSKLNESIETIKKFNEIYSECVKYT